MDPRYILSAFAGILAAVMIFAAVTTVKYVSHRFSGPITVRSG